MDKKKMYKIIVLILIAIMFVFAVWVSPSFIQETANAQDKYTDFKDIIEKAENYSSDFNFLLDEADRELDLYRETGNETYLELAKADIWVAMLVQLEYHEWYTYNLSKNESLDPIDDYLWYDIYGNEDRLLMYRWYLYEIPGEVKK